MKLRGRPPSEPESSSSPYKVPIASVTWWLGSEMDSWLAWPRRLPKLPGTSSRGLDEVWRAIDACQHDWKSLDHAWRSILSTSEGVAGE